MDWSALWTVADHTNRAGVTPLCWHRHWVGAWLEKQDRSHRGVPASGHCVGTVCAPILRSCPSDVHARESERPQPPDRDSISQEWPEIRVGKLEILDVRGKSLQRVAVAIQ